MKKVPESEAEPAAPRKARSILPRPGGPRPSEGATAAEPETETTIYRRDRLLASMTLITGAGVLVALPFALRAGAEFFLPVTAALVIAIALVPALEWLERRRVPSGLAAFLCLMLFLIIANAAVAAIVFPASEWVKTAARADRSRPRRRCGRSSRPFRISTPSSNNVPTNFRAGRASPAQTVTVETPNSLLQIIATSAPFAIIQMFFAILVIYFFLAGWTRMRKRTITNRASFDGAMTTARVIQQVVDATSTYLGTITLVNIEPRACSSPWSCG